ncbi:MAG: ATP-binding protein [Bryobacteraceae bacterium]
MFAVRSWTLRTRLTLWYVLVVAAVILVYIAGASFVMYWQMLHQLSRFAIEDVETVEGLLYFTPSGRLNLNQDYHNHPASRLILERFVEVCAPDGAVLFRNDRLAGRSLDGPLLPTEGVNGYSERSSRLSDGTRVLMVSRYHVLAGRPLIIRLGYDKQPIWSRIDESLTASFLSLPVILALAGLAGYHLARRSLAPLQQIASRAEQITAENLHARLPVENPADEVGHLARVFNSVLARLEESFERLQRFTSDASHELRTPLAAIRSVGEVGLQKSTTAADYQDTIGSMLEEVNRLTRLVENLLSISRADAGQLQVACTVIPLLEVAKEVTALLDVLIEEKAIQLIVSGDEQIYVKGDRLLLRQAITNVLHNAVKYTPHCGRISVNVIESPGYGIVRIGDSGPGIPEEHRMKVFDRFYRLDAARARDTGGAGLGLSIAKWALEVQNGVITVEDSAEGATFCICLAAADGRSLSPSGPAAEQHHAGAKGLVSS